MAGMALDFDEVVRNTVFAGSHSCTVETVREFEPVGNALCGVPVRSAASRNGTEGVPYKSLRRFEFPDTLA